MSLACAPHPIMPAPDVPGAGQSGSDTVITADQAGRTVTIPLGKTFVIRRPFDVEEWQVDFAAEIIELLSPPESRQAPGRDGWRFRTVGAGETDVALTERPAPGGGAPPAPRRFVFTIRVTKQ